MKVRSKLEIASIIIFPNAREEFHLALMEGNGRKYIELRICVRDPETGKASSTANTITINLELWPHFMAAVSRLGTWTAPLSFGGRQKHRNFGKGSSIFKPEVLLKNTQEQIFLEHQNFQGTHFILLKTSSRTTGEHGSAQVTIGPLLWSMFIGGLLDMEKVLLYLGWVAKEHDQDDYGLKLFYTEKICSNIK